jgi:hypothetical protein
MTLSGQVTAASPEWDIFPPLLITPDTSELIVQSGAPGIQDIRVNMDFLALNNSLNTGVIAASWDISEILEAQFSGAAISVFDRYTLFNTTRIIRYDVSEQLFSLTPQITLTPGNGLTVTPDGRFFISSSNPSTGSELTVYRVEGDGQSTITVVDSISEIEDFQSPRDAAAHPNGRFAFIMGWNILAIEIDQQTGHIIQIVEVQSAPSSNDLALSYDGQILLQTTNRFGGIARIIPYRVNGDGSLDPLQYGLEVPWSTSDLAFIPPKPQVTLPGDSNLDGSIDVADIVTVAEMISPTSRLAPAQNFVNADLDGDIDVDQDDLDALVGMLLGL